MIRAGSRKADSEDGESDVEHQGESGKGHVTEVEVRTLDIKTDPQSEDSNDPLLNDKTCVCVQMEQIPTPKKEHVLYLHNQHSPLQSTIPPECFESNSQMDKDDLNTEPKPFHINDMYRNELDSNPMEKKAPSEENQISSLCRSLSSVSGKETLEERAERILGIPFLDCITMQQPEEASSFLGFCVEDPEVKPFNIDERIPDDQRKEEQNELEAVKSVGASCLQENDVGNDLAENEDGRDCAGLQDQVSNTSQANNIDSQLESDIKPLSATEMTENALKPVTTEKEEQDTSSHHSSQFLSPPNDLSNSSLCSPFPDLEAPSPDLPLMLSSSDPTHLLHISKSEMEDSPDPELITLKSAGSPGSENSSLPHDPSPLSSASTDFSPSPSPLDFIYQIAEAVSAVGIRDEEGKTSQQINNVISDTFEDVVKEITEEIVSQQVESAQTDDATSVQESDVTDEQQTKEADKSPTDNIMEQAVVPSKENAKEVDILEERLECLEVEDGVCVKETCSTEEQLSPEEVHEEPTGCLDQSISQEHDTDSETLTEALQQQFDNGQEKDSYIQESDMTEEQSHIEADEDPAVQEQTQSTENDAQSEIEIKILQDIQPHSETFKSSPPSPSDSDCEGSQSASDVLSPPEHCPTPNISNKTDIEFDSLLEMDSVCPSALNPDAGTAAGIQEMVHPTLHQDSCEEPIEFSSSSCTDSPLLLLSSSSTLLPQEDSVSYDPDLTLKEEPEYPMSLWDAVNRIRKHTAPDSENEEEEVSELWDPENGGEDLGLPDIVVGIKSSKRKVFDGFNVLTAGSGEDKEEEQIKKDPCHEEPSAYAEEDTLSCSSHGSGDTVIEAEEDEVEEMPNDDGTESKTGEDDRMAEEEQCSSVEVEGAAKEKYPVEEEYITSRAVEMAQTGPEENEKVVLMTSEVSDEAIVESEPVKEI
ncbi:titin-like isoform X2 [Eleginops maclovinus]|uniref:titin-like isoform X2 n=1 Tax=Eleginops maclovinus TaxID=56733 RepID=UPI003080BFE5